MPQPLSGLRIIDFSRVLAGPLCGMYLGDLGADVVKVERPRRGDDTRAWTPPATPEGRSTYYLAVNRNKRSIALDLTTDYGQQAAASLISTADVLVDNFRPGTWTRFGFDATRLKDLNPRLVHASITGFGESVDLPGYDLLAQAASGLMSITGHPETGATKVGVAIVDVLAGLNLTIGILAALIERSRTGVGQQVSVDLMGSALAGLVNQASAAVNANETPRALGNRHPSIVPYETVPTATQPLALAVGNDEQFARLCAAIGRPSLATDHRYVTNRGRVHNRKTLMDELISTLRSSSCADWLSTLRDHQVPCAPVLDIHGALAFAEELGRDPVVTMTHADGSTTRTIRNPITMTDGRIRYRLAPPDLAQHSSVVMETLAPWPSEEEHSEAE